MTSPQTSPPPQKILNPDTPAGWLLAGWLAGCPTDWLAGRLGDYQAGCRAGWLAGKLAGSKLAHFDSELHNDHAADCKS